MKKLIKLGFVMLGLCGAVAGAQLAIAQVPIQNNDAQILRVIAMVDQNEIRMARLAQEKNIDRPVADYALLLEMDRNENLGELRRLSHELGIALGGNKGPVGQLRAKGEENILILAPLDQDDFSREFIWKIIRGHSDLLTWIDSQEAQNTDVKEFLNDTWIHLAFQLKKAQRIREQVLK